MECRRGEMCHHDKHGRDHNFKHGHGPGHPGGADFLTRELNLTEDQEEKFEVLRKEHFEKLKVNFDSMQALKKVMLQSLGKSEAEVNGTIQQIGAVEMNIQKETFDHFNKMYALCTDSQKVILKDKLQHVIGHHGPGFAHKGKEGDVHGGPHGNGKSCCSMPPKRF